jgi:hypothetical protein
MYEGPNTDSPTPLLVARVIPRGTSCLIHPDTRIQQPWRKCSNNEGFQAGAARPLGFWDGGVSGVWLIVIISTDNDNNNNNNNIEHKGFHAGAARPLGFWDGGVSGVQGRVYLICTCSEATGYSCNARWRNSSILNFSCNARVCSQPAAGLAGGIRGKMVCHRSRDCTANASKPIARMSRCF